MALGNPALIIDPGSDLLKAGFSGDNLPSVVVPTVVGVKEIKLEPSEEGPEEPRSCTRTHHIGHEAHHKVAHLTLHYPVKNGIIVDFGTLEKIVSHISRDLFKINMSEYPVLFTEIPVQPGYLREKLIQLAFEDLGVPGFYTQDSASLSLMYSGLLSGTIVESGDAVTNTSVVVDGVLDRNTIPKTFYAGKDVTYDLYTMLTEKGYEFHSVDKKHLRDIKETLAFVSLDFEKDLSQATSSGKYEQNYYLPSGEIVTVNEERFQCCEGLFNPERFGCQSPGIHMQVQRTLELAEYDDRKKAGENIILSGGNTMLTGFKERLKKELDALMIPDCVFGNINALDDRKFAAWIGGSMMTQLSSMKEKWITKQEYEEEGAYLVERKCP